MSTEANVIESNVIESTKLIELKAKKAANEAAMSQKYLDAKKASNNDPDNEELLDIMYKSMESSRTVETGKDENGKVIKERVFTDTLTDREIAVETLAIKRVIDEEKSKAARAKIIAVFEIILKEREDKAAIALHDAVTLEKMRNAKGFDAANTSDEYKGLVITANESNVNFETAQNELYNFILGLSRVTATSSNNAATPTVAKDGTKTSTIIAAYERGYVATGSHKAGMKATKAVNANGGENWNVI